MADLTTTTTISENDRQIVMAFQYQYIDGGTVQVEADATVDVQILHLDENQSGYQDYSIFGGLPKTTTYGASPTGDILFTTTGAGAVTDSYQIVFRMIKEY